MASVFSGKAGRNAAIWSANIAPQFTEAVTNVIRDGEGRALDTLGMGYDQARGQYGSALEYFEPWAAAGRNALGMQTDGLGLNGQAGSDAAFSAFEATPGRQYEIDTAADAVARRASAMGMLGSGNAMTAISDRAQNEANRQYGSWLDRVGDVSKTGLVAAGQQSGLVKGQGDLFANEGLAKAGVISGATSLEAANQQNLGNTILGLGQNAFKAGQDAATNRTNFGMGLGSTALSLLGMKTGADSTLGSSIWSSLKGLGG